MSELPTQRAALAAVRQDALNKAVHNLAELVNQHTLLWMALCKKLGVTPAELIADLKPEDFINPDDNKLIETPDDN